MKNIEIRRTTFTIGKDGKRKRKRNRIRNLDVCGKQKACQTT